MHWLLVGYMFLFIHRPFEVWPALGDIRIERIYMLFTLAVWAAYPGKRWLPNWQHAGYAAFATAVLVCWAASPWAERSQPLVEDYFKIVVFYVLLVTTVKDEQGLKRMIIGFVAVMGVYLAHSLREYVGGRYTHRMGIARMIGVDSTMGDPNSFGAGIIYALPFVVALWKAEVGGRLGRWLLTGYTGLSVLCLLLTGSRSSLIGLSVFTLITVMRSRRRWACLTAIAVAAPVGFLALPPSLQTRFETIIDSDVGPANAKESGEGRIMGFLTGMQLWAANPLTGIGPGAWRPATRSTIESHNLYGQLAGELGSLGVGGFLAVLAGFVMNLRATAKVKRAYPEWQNDLVSQVPRAVGTALFLLLMMGMFGHNMFRFTWLWYGGFLIIARHCLAVRVREAAFAEPEAEELPAGWQAHPGHAPAWET